MKGVFGCLAPILIILGIILGLAVNSWWFLGVGIGLILIGLSLGQGEDTPQQAVTVSNWRIENCERTELLAAFGESVVDDAIDCELVYFNLPCETFVSDDYNSIRDDLIEAWESGAATASDPKYYHAAYRLLLLEVHSCVMAPIWQEICDWYEKPDEENIDSIIGRHLSPWQRMSIPLNENYERLTSLSACEQLNESGPLPSDEPIEVNHWFDENEELFPFSEFQVVFFEELSKELRHNFEMDWEPDSQYTDCLEAEICLLQLEQPAEVLKEIWEDSGEKFERTEASVKEAIARYFFGGSPE